MSNVDPNNTDDPNENPNAENIKVLRQQAEDGKAAQKALAEANKKLLFAEAGIDYKSEIGQLLFETHQGDDLAELKERAARLGALTAPAKTAEEIAREAEDTVRAAAQLAAGGGRPAGGAQPEFEGEHPTTVALTKFQENMRKGMDKEQAQIEAVAYVLGAASKGDKRVFFDREAHEAAAAEADALSVTARDR